MPAICLLVVLAVLLCAPTARAQTASQPPQTQEDDYTRYELLAPGTAKFRILYEVTATRSGARFFFNAIRKGSVATDEQVSDPMTGRDLKWEVVSGKQARAEGHPTADLETEWIKVHLARPVPANGQARVLIDKTYEDAASYRRDGDAIVFERSLGIRRNSLVLPPGFRLVSCNVPSQVLTTEDGRVMVSFMNPGPGAAALVVRARPGLASGAARPATTAEQTRSPTPGSRPVSQPLPSQAARLVERSRQDREIVYFLDDPATHRFSLYHDYTESRPGVDKYVNVVRAGSTVSNPSAVLLDTGETLRHETLTGESITRAKIDVGGAVDAGTEAVVIRFPPVEKGQSIRIRISETYTDKERYYLDGDDLVWDRGFGRPRNTVVLPAGWTVVASAIPATVSEAEDGRQRLYFENARPDEIQVLIRARRHQ